MIPKAGSSRENADKGATMSEKAVIIDEQDGAYRLENNEIPELTLIGILECIFLR